MDQLQYKRIFKNKAIRSACFRLGTLQWHSLDIYLLSSVTTSCKQSRSFATEPSERRERSAAVPQIMPAYRCSAY